MDNHERCPVCKQYHPVGIGKPRIINCECGAILKMFVPMFKMSDTGFVFRVIGATKAIEPSPEDLK